MRIMTILGSVLDENSLIEKADNMARFAISDEISRRIILPEIKEWLNKDFTISTATCDLYISLETFKPIGFRVIDEEKGEDIFFDDIPCGVYNKGESDSVYEIICQHLVCRAIKETSF